jgi:hypothetical protein
VFVKQRYTGEYLTAGFQERAPLIRKMNLSSGLLKEPGVQAFFQLLHLHGYRWLSDEKFPGSSGKVAQSCDAFEYLKLPKRNVSQLVRCDIYMVCAGWRSHR